MEGDGRRKAGAGKVSSGPNSRAFGGGCRGRGVPLSTGFPETTLGDNLEHPDQALVGSGETEGWFSEPNHIPGWYFLERTPN